ncbi:MAG: ribosome small subunit-dependent GTPase A [Clostridia bacterium]|nr:ribosome small subunit-dependent GTPase A [Clostridia bacterium]
MSIIFHDNTTGIIVKAVSGFYYVNSGEHVYECKARGNFRHAKISPIVGDKVTFTPGDDLTGVIESILPRKNCLLRPTVANIDKIIIVSSFENPSPDTFLIDRLTAIAVFSGITPIIVFNKSDIGDFGNTPDIYKKAGFNTYVVSAKREDTLNSLKLEFKDCVCAMAGNSGVGKSSLINALFGNLDLKTGEVSTALGRGRHTTRHTELFKNEFSGYIADTPGFSSVANVDNKFEFKQNLSNCFTDFAPYLNCKFTTCTHTCEIGCGVLRAISEGKIEKSRHNSYVALLNELKDVNSWNQNKG